MSKKYILISADKTLSPSQVYLEKLSSGVFRDLFSSGSCGYNNLLQREEAKKSPKRSPYKRPKAKVKCGASLAKRKPPSAAPKKAGGAEGVSKAAQAKRIHSGSSSTLPTAAAYMAVVGSSVESSSRALPKLRETCVSSSARTKGPCTLRAAVTREAESAKKLCILAAVKPANVESEKVKFFKSGFSYDPQFQYSSPASSLVLARHNKASDRFLTQVSLERLGSLSQGSFQQPQRGAGRRGGATAPRKAKGRQLEQRVFQGLSTLLGGAHLGAGAAALWQLRGVRAGHGGQPPHQEPHLAQREEVHGEGRLRGGGRRASAALAMQRGRSAARRR